MTASAVSATAAGRQSAELEGEPQKHRTPTSKRLLNASLPVYTALLVIYMFLPIAVMIIFSFNDPQGRQNITWQGFTIQNYFDVWSRPDITGPMLNSLLIALVSTIIATILGTLIGLALTRYQFRGQTPVNLLIYVPMATPEVIMGASLLALWVSVDVARGMPTILIAHVMFCISFVVVTIRARISGFNRSLEEAAMDLGADSLDDLPQGDPAAHLPRHPGRGHALVRPVDRRLRHHVVRFRPDADLPAVGLRRVPAWHAT